MQLFQAKVVSIGYAVNGVLAVGAVAFGRSLYEKLPSAGNDKTMFV